jgi:signal transduction histidine kinase
MPAGEPPAVEEIEITGPLELDPEERDLLVMHSVRNLLSVVVTSLNLLQSRLGVVEPLEEVIDRACALAHALRFRNTWRETLTGVVGLPAMLDARLGPLLAAQGDRAGEPGVNQDLENLRSLFSVAGVRVAEIMDRLDAEEGWHEHKIEALRTNLHDFLAAVEKNAGGRYRIVTAPGDAAPGDYVAQVDITSVGGATIRMPAVVQDVMRDLLANARKYTPPGGRLRAALDDDGRRLRLVVEDSGRGIPTDQVNDVVKFGFRGRNVTRDETMGGGFGLTKAYETVRRWNGRMWIASQEGAGTRVTLEIPRPHTAQSNAT